MNKTIFIKSLFVVVGLLLLLVSCNQTPIYPPTDALFGDDDVDAASRSVASSNVALEGFDGNVLPEGQTIEGTDTEGELSSQAVLANTTGFIVYIRNDPASTQPWQIFRYDQAGKQPLCVIILTTEMEHLL